MNAILRGEGPAPTEADCTQPERDVLELLRLAPRAWFTVAEVARERGLRPDAARRALAELRRAGLISYRDGPEGSYRAVAGDPEPPAGPPADRPHHVVALHVGGPWHGQVRAYQRQRLQREYYAEAPSEYWREGTPLVTARTRCYVPCSPRPPHCDPDRHPDVLVHDDVPRDGSAAFFALYADALAHLAHPAAAQR